MFLIIIRILKMIDNVFRYRLIKGIVAKGSAIENLYGC